VRNIHFHPLSFKHFYARYCNYNKRASVQMISFQHLGDLLRRAAPPRPMLFRSDQIADNRERPKSARLGHSARYAFIAERV
jgi:hypothetical protein